MKYKNIVSELYKLKYLEIAAGFFRRSAGLIFLSTLLYNQYSKSTKRIVIYCIILSSNSLEILCLWFSHIL